MGANQKATQSQILLICFLLTATFQVIFSAPKQIQTHMKVRQQTQSPPNRIGASLVFRVYGNVYPNGFFYTTVSLGTPLKTYFLDIDTGSKLTWVQCAAAPTAKLLKAPNYPYKPNNNAVYCNDRLCAFIDRPSNDPCKSPNDQCDYEVEYADHGSSLGVLVRDSFSIKFTNGSIYTHALAFGCGYDQEFSASIPPPYVDGVLGLANGKSGIVTQLYNLGVTQNVIGHCFSRQGGGFLFFGNDLLPSGTVWTPMLTNSLDHYLAGPADLILGGNTLVSRGLYVIFDTGSTYTYLNSQAYRATLSKVKAGLAGKPLAPVKDGNLPICWKGSKPFQSIDAVKNYFSSLVLRFTSANKAQFVLPPEAYLIVTSHGNVCLGILDGAEAKLGNLNIIGDISLLEKVVVYDNERKMIGWAPSNCNRLPQS